MAAKHGLGRGLGALMGGAAAAPVAAPAPAAAAAPKADSSVMRVPLDSIQKSPWQPRRVFAEEGLQELISSIKERGVLQPLLVRRKGAGYELIAGERRFRASREAGLTTVPVLVMEAADQDALEMALVENLQRKDLNVIEEAEGYRQLADTFRLTQEQIAQRVGKARASVTNAMRLLALGDEVKNLIAGGRVSPGHAKVLLGVESPSEQRVLADRVAREDLSVRALEHIVAHARQAPVVRVRQAKDDIPADHVTYLSDVMQRHFGTSVRLTACKTLANGKKAKGTLEIDFFTNEDLTRLMERMGVPDVS